MSLSTIEIEGNDYQSYASVAEADITLAADPTRGTTWAATDDEQKGIYLVAATQRLDLLPWRGERAGGFTGDDAQETAWPRSGLVYPDGESIPDDVIPDALERATALLAGSIASRPAQAEQGSSSSSISELKAGSVTIKYFRHQQSVQGQPLQDETAYELVRRWIIGTGADTGGAVFVFAGGTSEESTFSDRDRYGRTRGF